MADILTGQMTTIDKTGKFVSQVMENYADRKETDVFAAIAKQIIHFKSDITTSMGLPAPMMGLFNFLQFGEFGEYDQTIAEMYILRKTQWQLIIHNGLLLRNTHINNLSGF